MVSGVEVRELMPAFLYLYVDDADATYSVQLKPVTESLEDPRDTPYGDRRAMVRDPGGNIWQIATHNREAFDAFHETKDVWRRELDVCDLTHRNLFSW